jgi:hypothetical protein
MDENLIVFWEDKIGVVYGDGPNDLGQGGSFTLPRIVAHIGLTAAERRSVVQMPLGIMFKSNDGIKLLDRSMQIVDVGRDVADYNSHTIIGAELSEDAHQVKFSATGPGGYGMVLVYDYQINYWTRYKIDVDNPLLDTAMLGTDHIILNSGSDSIMKQDTTVSHDRTASNKVEYYIETNWIKLSGLQGYQRIYRAWLLGEYIGRHTLTIDIDYDYNENNTDTLTLSDAETTALSSLYQPKFGIPKQRCQAIKFKLTFATTTGQTANGCAKITALRLECGVDRRAMRKKNVYSTYT